MYEKDKVLAYPKSSAFQDSVRETGAEGRWPFVTISRQAGAGGASLAERLAQLLSREEGELFEGWRIYDRELCEQVAADPKLSVLLENLLQERYREGLEDWAAQLLASASPQAAVTHRMFKLIRAAALGGKAIIVGRAGSCVTRGLPLGVHVRLAGSPGRRLYNLMERTGLPRAKAELELRRLDADRTRLVKSYFHKDIDDPLLYDAVLNIDKVSEDLMARLLIETIKDRQAAREERLKAAL